MTDKESLAIPRMSAFGHKIIRVMALSNNLNAEYNAYTQWHTPLPTENVAAKNGGCAHKYVPDGFSKNMRRCTKCGRVEVG